MTTPIDSSTVMPSRGSTPSGPNSTRPAVARPMSSIRAKPNSYSCAEPSACSYVDRPMGITPIRRSSEAGAIESIAPLSTRKLAS